MLTPRAALTLDDKLYEEQILGLRLSRVRGPALDRLEVALPLATVFEATPGTACSLVLDGGDPDGGGGEAEVFTGRLTAVTRRGDALILTAQNGGQILASYRPVGAYEQVGLDEVIETFCADAGVDVAIDLEAPKLALYATAGQSTAWSEISRLAALAGGAPGFDGAGVCHVTPYGGPDTELALLYGRELLLVDIAEGAQPADAITVVGEGAGDPTSPEARWLSVDFLAGSAPAPGLAARRRRVPELRNSNDTEAAGTALAERRSTAVAPVRLTAWLMPTIAPGTRLEIAELPDPLSLSDCRVTQVVHTLQPGRPARTEIRALGQAAEGAGLLGALAGAVGGLL